MAEKRTARRWFREHHRQQLLLAGFGGLAMIPVTIAAHFFAWWLYLNVLFLGRRFRLEHPEALEGRQLACWVLVAITYPLFHFFGRDRVEEAQPGEVGRHSSVGMSMYARRYFLMKLVIILGMLAPAATYLTVFLFLRWRKLAAVRIDDLSLLFSRLWKEDGKVPSRTLFADHDVAEEAALSAQFQLFDGINHLPSGEPGFAIGSELRREIREWKKKDPD